MLGRDLAGAILELPRRIGEDCAEALPARRSEEVDGGVAKRIVGWEHNEICFAACEI